MPPDSAEQKVTMLLVEWRRRAALDRALDRAIPIVYGELRRGARARLSGEGAHTLQTTALWGGGLYVASRTFC